MAAVVARVWMQLLPRWRAERRRTVSTDCQVTERLQVADFVVLNPRGVLCARLLSPVPSTADPGVSNPSVFAELRPGPCPGIAHVPLVVVAVTTEIARAKSFARHLESPIGTPFWSQSDSAFDSSPGWPTCIARR
jgi:hypothetical protein